ncbi:MAG: glutamate--tRNA ligase [Candidatus Kaiserbacteria bacterium]|nr:glutamate--tRNA ligase [Candidatus Kaiserbacteria bacterium]
MTPNFSGVRVRLPPSPTGYCHVGTARMAIINFLFAKKNNGTIVFRSEDTDKERSKKEFETDIIDSLHWLGLEWDEFYRQSERTEIYRTALHSLIDSRRAYVSAEDSKKEPGKIVNVVRLKNPGTKVTFTDLVRGEITFDTTELGDFVIARSADDPLYHFAAVVDDAKMGITHVIRGDDHISNTPRQILIQESLGYDRPQYAHYPLLLGSDKSKLSKRTGDTSVKSYREEGYLPKAFFNYIAMLGWTPKSEREIMSVEEMIQEFEIADLHKSGAVFDMEKLRWFNRSYLLKMPAEEFERGALAIMESSLAVREVKWSEETGKSILNLVRERIHVWGDLRALIAEGELDYFFANPVLATDEIPGKGGNLQDAEKHLKELQKIIVGIPANSFNNPEKIKTAIWDYASREGRGEVLWPLRYSLSGRKQSPDPFQIASIIGKDAVIGRIESAVNQIAL